MLLSAKTGRVRETTPLRRLSHKFEEMKNRVIIHRLHFICFLAIIALTNSAKLEPFDKTNAENPHKYRLSAF